MPDKPELRYFGIPGNSTTTFDPELHGLELSDEDLGSGDFCEIAWRPGEYSYSAGSSGTEYVFKVPESSLASQPNIKVFMGIHEFLCHAHDEEVGGWS